MRLPLGHQYTYLRPVDYVSAACAVFPKQLFQQLGGFDPQYGLGYVAHRLRWRTANAAHACHPSTLPPNAAAATAVALCANDCWSGAGGTAVDMQVRQAVW